MPLLHEEGGRPPTRIGLAHPSIAPYGVFKSAEGREILISIQSDREWRAFAQKLLGDDALGRDPRFSTNNARVKNRAETDRLVADAFGKLERKQLLARLAEADIALAEVNDMAALSTHPHLRRITVDTVVGPVAYPAPGAIVDDQDRRYGSVPSLGENQNEILGSKDS